MSENAAPPPQTMEILLVRCFGWWMLALLFAYLLNNYLNLGQGWAGVAPIFGEGDAGGQSWIQLLIYIACVGAVTFFCVRTPKRGLRLDSDKISAFNIYLVRGAFWAVLLVGLADMAISFLRVEGFLAEYVGEEMATQLGRSKYRGPNVHMPLLLAGFVIAIFVRGLGFTWLALMIVIAELAIVFTRFVFSYEQAFMGDLVRFWYAALFLFASAYTLLEDGHVRVDVFYAGFSRRKKGKVNAFGSIALGMSMCWVIILVGMSSATAIINSPMLNFEVSQSGFGMYTKYWMAGFLGVFAITMQIQFSAYWLEAYADFRGHPGGREVQAGSGH